MSQQSITISQNAATVISRVNANFLELFNEFGSGLTRQVLTEQDNAGNFISKCNTNFSNLFTAASPSQSRTPLTDSMSATQVVNALNTNFDALYDTESGGGEVVPVEKLKVLFFGNSYTANSVFYLPFVLQTLLDSVNSELEFKISFFFAAGTAIDYYYNNYKANVAPQIYTFESGYSTWQQTTSKIEDAVKSDDWDLVVLQQFSQESFLEDSYNNVGNLVGLINESTAGKNTKIGWNVTHPNGAVAYNYPLKTFSIIQSVCEQNGINVILPYGTAICNALTKKVCRSYANPSNNPTRSFRLSDNTHLSPGLPMYIASLAIAQALSDEFSLGFSVQDDTTTPTVGWSTPESEDYKGIWPTYTNSNFLEVTEAFRAIAKSAVAAAMTSKFSVTQLDGETMTVTYNLTGCSIIGTAPTTGINFGETISFRIVADQGKTMSSVSWRRLWGGDVSMQLGENGEFEKVVTEDLVITATAT